MITGNYHIIFRAFLNISEGETDDYKILITVILGNLGFSSLGKLGKSKETTKLFSS